MSYEIQLTRPCNHKILEEEQLTQEDKVTTVLNRPMNNTSDVVVRINDFPRARDFQTEKRIVEDVTDQLSVSNLDTIFVSQGPIYDGSKIGRLATEYDVVVKIKIEDEDVSGQFTGTETSFVVQGRPILTSSQYDFSAESSKTDIVVKINGIEVETKDIVDFLPRVGRVQLSSAPDASDVVTVNYYFRSKLKEIDSINSKIVLKEKPVVGQEVKVEYYSRVSDGWRIEKSKIGLLNNSSDIVFSQPRNTLRDFVDKEDVSSQFNGENYTFVTDHKPILPLYQDFYSTVGDTLNNAVKVWVNDIPAKISALFPEEGVVRLVNRPASYDVVKVSYYYDNGLEPDRISIDYSVDRIYCNKCRGNVALADYRLNSVGSYIKIRNEEKLIQDLEKIVITQIGTDNVATWYGTNYESFIGQTMLPDFVKTRISTEIINALTNLKNAQIQQEDYQTVTPNEFLNIIQLINVSQSEAEPTFYFVEVDVVTQAGTQFTVTEQIDPEEFLFSS